MPPHTRTADDRPIAHPLASIWPPARVRVVTPRLELRLPNDEETVELTQLVAKGVHDPSTMPFASPWSEQPDPDRSRSSVQWQAQLRGEWQPERWTFHFAVFVDGQVAGAQDLRATTFATRREAASGSWLGRSFHGRGLGTEMRQAVLHLAFAGLDAEWAVSSAYEDNAASCRVSEKCGYQPDGINVVVRRRGPEAPNGPAAAAAIERRFRLSRAGWEPTRRSDIELHGIDDEVRSMVGLD